MVAFSILSFISANPQNILRPIVMEKSLALQQTFNDLHYIGQQVLPTNHKWIMSSMSHFDRGFLYF